LKRSHKFQSLAGAAGVIAGSASLTAAAQRLGVNRSTLHRWIAAGKVPRPERSRRTRQPAAGPSESPESWRHWARASFDLTPVEETLVDLAEQALSMARDQTARPEIRLAATARFQQLVRQLNFEAPIDGKEETTTPVRSWPRRVA